MKNDTQVFSGHQELPERPYMTRDDVLNDIFHAHALEPRTLQRWPGVRNTWTYTLNDNGEETIYTRYQKTDICCITVEDLLVLTPEGFYTTTTKARLNEVMHHFAKWGRPSIYQDQLHWWIEAHYSNGTKCYQLPFEEGMRLNRDSELVDYDQPAPRLDDAQFSQGVLLNEGFME